MAARAVVLAACCAGWEGCQGSSRPPPLKDDEFASKGSPSPLADGGGQVLDPGAPTVPTCNLGPNGGVCACVDQELAADPPNLYFVLDRSGSMNTDDKWNSVVSALGQIVLKLGARAKVGVAVFPDPNATTDCAVGREVFPPTRGDSVGGVYGVQSLALIGGLANLGAAGGTPTAATLNALAPRIESLAGKTYVILATDGGPNCNSNATCDASDCQLNIESTGGCQPAGPNCCTNPPTVGDSDDCLDSQPTIDAVTAIAAANTPVFVVGIPGSEPYADLLDSLALAGDTQRGSEPQYYDIGSADQAAFQSALFKVAAAITASCTLVLDQAPPDPELVNVFLDETPLPQAGPDGWTLSGQTVTLMGASCSEVLGGQILDVRVVAGCKTIVR